MPFIFLIFAIFVMIIAGWAIMSVKTPSDIEQKKQEDTPKPIQKPATVMEKQIRDKGIAEPTANKISKNYIVFFKLADGTKFGVSVEQYIYDSIKIGEQGPLTLKGGRYVDFNHRNSTDI